MLDEDTTESLSLRLNLAIMDGVRAKFEAFVSERSPGIGERSRRCLMKSIAALGSVGKGLRFSSPLSISPLVARVTGE